MRNRISMKFRKLPIIAVAICVLPSALLASQQQVLKIYIPRTIQVQAGADVKLGGIAVIQGEDTAMVAHASQIGMGRCPLPGEQIRFDRKVILSRLVANGISSSKVSFTGSDTVGITRNERLIQPGAIVRCAEDLLAKLRPLPTGGTYELQTRLDEWLLPGGQGEITMRANLVSESNNQIIVNVIAAGESCDLGSKRLVFSVHLPRYETVALREILPGETITPQNAQIRATTGAGPADPDWRHPFGLVSAAAVPQGSIIHPRVLKAPQPATLVRRNQSVVMKVSRPGFTISALGIALQDGKTGELIRVQNTDTKRVVTAKVESDGTVEPVVEERS